MDELRAALAIARKDIRNVSRYRFSVASSIFTPLYQGVLPGLLFGASFAVGGKVVGLDKTIGTADLAQRFLGNVLPKDFDGSEGKALHRLCQRFGWEAFAAELRDLILPAENGRGRFA